MIWLKDVVFSWRWWFGVALTILPWAVWFIFRKKESTDRYLYVAYIVIIIATVLDVLGDQFGLWHYRYKVIPIEPTYFPLDLTLMPVSIIILLQIKPKANPWIKAVIFALVASYVAEPVLAGSMSIKPSIGDIPIQFPFSFVFISFVIGYIKKDFVLKNNSCAPFFSEG